MSGLNNRDPAFNADQLKTAKTRCEIARIQAPPKFDGTPGDILGFANFDLDLIYNDGAGEVTYLSEVGAEPSQIKQGIGYQPDSVELGLVLRQDSPLQETDIVRRKWSKAALRLMEIDWSNLTLGPDVLFEGWIEDIVLDGGRAIAKAQSLVVAYNETIGDTIVAKCRANFGGPKCLYKLTGLAAWSGGQAVSETFPGRGEVGTRLRPTAGGGLIAACLEGGTTHATTEPTWPTTEGEEVDEVGATARWIMEKDPVASGVLSAGAGLAWTVTGAVTKFAADNYVGGHIVITGAPAGKEGLIGQAAEIKSYDPVTGALVIHKRIWGLLADPALTLDIFPGCQHTGEACIGFNNYENFYKGDLHVPGDDQRLVQAGVS